MDITALNTQLAQGNIDQPGVFPHLDKLAKLPLVFTMDFGLNKLPKEDGILLIRGARQYGKSTWLEEQLYNTIHEFGAGSAYYLNGENIAHADNLEEEIDTLISVFEKNAPVRRLFIDEITAIVGWEIALKRMADRGKLRGILIITTGSNATDLRRGSERLPGRKGKLARSTYLFTPISYREFHRVCHKKLKSDTLLAYLLSGGSPIACSELALSGTIPDYVIELVRDWVEGEISRTGRSRGSLINILSTLYRFGGTPIGQAKLAREAAMTNNTVAAGYIDILNDLGCVVPAYPWDPERKILILRKPCKYHFTNLLVALAYHPARIRSLSDFKALPETTQGYWYEWLVAQELLRRTALKGDSPLEPLSFWETKNHEIDFVDSEEQYWEVKRGKSSALEFSWFPKQLPHKILHVINTLQFETQAIRGLTFEDFLLDHN
jgi:predicted AAA+ superfamily ATPase